MLTFGAMDDSRIEQKRFKTVLKIIVAAIIRKQGSWLGMQFIRKVLT